MRSTCWCARVRLSVFAFVILALGACSDGGSGDRQTTTFSVSGTVVDGPIVGATVRALDRNGVEIAMAQADATARYQLDIPTNANLPVRISATGGEDLVTNRAADFLLLGVVGSTDVSTVNLSPLSTFTVHMGECG